MRDSGFRANIVDTMQIKVTVTTGPPAVILLVDDDDLVRMVVRRMLETRGYVILEASGGREGLQWCQSHPDAIDLLLTDVLMPEVDGPKLAERAVKMRPGIRVMFMSGHNSDVIPRENAPSGALFLQKPFTVMGLNEKVREALNREASFVHSMH